MRRSSAKNFVPQPQPATTDVLAAAVAAYRECGEVYTKDDPRPTIVDGMAVYPRVNKTVLRDILANPVRITPADRARAQAIATHYGSAFTLALLTRPLSPIEVSIRSLLESPTASPMAIGLAAWLPHGYRDAMAKEGVSETVYDRGRRHLGTIGDRVTVTVTPIQSRWSQQWGTAYNLATVGDDAVVKFTYRDLLPLGTPITVTGTVTHHLSDGGGRVTRLHRVKVVPQ